MVERVGFEPTIPVSRDNRFRGGHLQPLSHLSQIVNYILFVFYHALVLDATVLSRVFRLSMLQFDINLGEKFTVFVSVICIENALERGLFDALSVQSGDQVFRPVGRQVVEQAPNVRVNVNKSHIRDLGPLRYPQASWILRAASTMLSISLRSPSKAY